MECTITINKLIQSSFAELQFFFLVMNKKCYNGKLGLRILIDAGQLENYLLSCENANALEEIN